MELPPKGENQPALIDFWIPVKEAYDIKQILSSKSVIHDIHDKDDWTIFAILARIVSATYTGIWIEFKSDFLEKEKPEAMKLFIADSWIKSIVLLQDRKIDSFGGKFPVGFRSQGQEPQT